MRIIVMSDSHRNYHAIEKVISKNLGNADIFVHLGDGEDEVDPLRLKYPHLDIRCVSGNCDYMSSSPDFFIIDVKGARIFCTHGHRYFVKGGTETLRSIARDNKCNVVLFGHTHERYQSYEDGIYIMNPGSCSCPRDGKSPSYGFVDVTDKGIITNIVEL